MNRKKIKKIRKQALVILKEWLLTLLNEEDKEELTDDKLLSLLPKQTHITHGRTTFLSAFSFKWTVKKLKYLTALQPNRPIDTYTYEEDIKPHVITVR
jgi:mitochondrial fission protein ELM1|tara:strand:- start:301 stop:594 length:294 start_codon:yes stop_codon:yes gene_type:complete